MTKSAHWLLALLGSIAMYSTTWAEKEAELTAGAGRSLTSIPAGNAVIYLGTGLVSGVGIDAAVAVHCTSYNRETSPASVYPFNIAIEFYSFSGAIRAIATLVMSEQDGTRTVTSQPTTLYVADNVQNVSLVQGSLRVYAPSKQAAGILCSADLTSKTSPPNYQREVPLTRVGPKFKAPRAIFTP